MIKPIWKIESAHTRILRFSRHFVFDSIMKSIQSTLPLIDRVHECRLWRCRFRRHCADILLAILRSRHRQGWRPLRTSTGFVLCVKVSTISLMRFDIALCLLLCHAEYRLPQLRRRKRSTLRYCGPTTPLSTLWDELTALKYQAKYVPGASFGCVGLFRVRSWLHPVSL